MNLGEKILSLRKARGWSQARLAAEAGMAQQTVFNFENNRFKHPPIDKMYKLALTLNVNPKELYQLAGLSVEPPTENERIIAELEDIKSRVDTIIDRMRQS